MTDNAEPSEWYGFPTLDDAESSGWYVRSSPHPGFVQVSRDGDWVVFTVSEQHGGLGVQVSVPRDMAGDIAEYLTTIGARR